MEERRVMERDDQGDPLPLEPLYVQRSEVPDRGLVTVWASSDTWGCREHPGWTGEDMSERDLARWERDGTYDAEDGRARGVWERESLQAHARLHGIAVAEDGSAR